MNPSQAKQASPLDQLPPLAMPEAIGWWPLAPGWWLVFFVCILMVAAFIYFGRQYYLNTRLRRSAIQLAQQHWSDYLASSDSRRYLIDIASLIRRFCRHQYKDTKMINSSGTQWLQYLDHCAGRPLLNNQEGERLLSIYQNPGAQGSQPNNPYSNQQLAETHRAILQWITKMPLKQNRQSFGIRAGESVPDKADQLKVENRQEVTPC